MSRLRRSVLAGAIALVSPASRMGPLESVERQEYGTAPAPVMGPPCCQ